MATNDDLEFDFNPLDKNAKDRGYTGDHKVSGDDGIEIGEPEFIKNKDDFVTAEEMPDFDDNDKGAKQNEQQEPTNLSSDSQDNSDNDFDDFDNLKDSEETLEKEVQTEQNKVSEEYAEAFSSQISTQFVTSINSIAKNVSKFDDLDIALMSSKGLIDLDIEFLNTNQPIGAVIQDINTSVEKAFQVKDEQIVLIKEPLKQIILEEGKNLSPRTQLLLGLGFYVLGTGATTVSLLRQKKKMLKIFKSETENSKKIQNDIINKLKSDISNLETKLNGEEKVVNEKVDNSVFKEEINVNTEQDNKDTKTPVKVEVVDEETEVIKGKTLADISNIDV